MANLKEDGGAVRFIARTADGSEVFRLKVATAPDYAGGDTPDPKELPVAKFFAATDEELADQVDQVAEDTGKRLAAKDAKALNLA